MKKWLVAIAGIAVSAVVIAILLTKIEWKQTLEILANTGFRLPALLVLIYLLTFPIRAHRWRYMLPPGTLTFSQSLKGIVVGFAGNNVLPARGGEFLRMEYLHRSAPGVGRITAISSVMVERILDGLTLLGILVAALTASTIQVADHPWLRDLRTIALVVFGLACGGTILLRAWGMPLVGWLAQHGAKPAAAAAALLQRLYIAVRFLGLNRSTAGAVATGICVWSIEGLMFVVACWHFGLGAQSIVAGYLTLAVVNFGLLVPSSPGYLGVFQAMTILALQLFGVNTSEGLALGLVVHACQFVPVTVWGLAIMFHESIRASTKATWDNGDR